MGNSAGQPEEVAVSSIGAWDGPHLPKGLSLERERIQSWEVVGDEGGKHVGGIRISSSSSSSSRSRSLEGGSGNAKTFRRTYRLEKVIGQGSHSFVFLATRRETSAAVAVKCVNTEKLGQKRMEYLQREIEVLHLINSHQVPFSLRLLDFFDDPEGCFIVQELAEGGDLFSMLKTRDKMLGEGQVKHIAWRLLHAAKQLHSLGVVHRDIKPENLLLSKSHDVKSVRLGDFGFAVFLNEDTRKGGLPACGTPEFIAPELLLMEPFDGKADVWSIGVTLYGLLSGALPFSAMTANKLYELILDGDYTFPEASWHRVSTHAVDFVRRMLQVECSDRATAEQMLQHAWLEGVEAQDEGRAHSPPHAKASGEALPPG